MPNEYLNYLVKARENLRIAEYSFEQKCFNVCASRAYYAMFQAALAALVEAGLLAKDKRANHGWVQATFNERFIKRKKVYPASFKSMLMDTMITRHIADYRTRMVSRGLADKSLRAAQQFVETVTSVVQGEENEL